MADITLNQTLVKPTLTFTCLSTFSIVNTTLRQPTLNFIVNDWSVSQTLRQPTLTAYANSGFALSKTLARPTITFNMVVGTLSTVNLTLRKPTLTFVVVEGITYVLDSTLRKPTLAGTITQGNYLRLNTTLRQPSLIFILPSVLSSAKVYAFNLLNQASTEYDNYYFNSMFKLNGRYYGINTSGVYELTGDRDVTTYINSEVDLPISSFDKQGMKACSNAVLLGRLEGDVEFKIVMDEQEEREGMYITDDGRAGLHRIRVKVPKGLKGAVVQPKLRNVDGSQFSVNALEIMLAELQRLR